MINRSVKLFVFLPDLQLHLLDATDHPDDLFLKCSLVSCQIAHLLLEPLALRIHIRVVAVDFLNDTVQLVGQCLASVLALHSQDRFERLFLGAQNLDLLLVHVEVFRKLPASFCQMLELSLHVSGVLIGLLSRLPRHSHLLEAGTLHALIERH